VRTTTKTGCDAPLEVPAQAVDPKRQLAEVAELRLRGLTPNALVWWHPSESTITLLLHGWWFFTNGILTALEPLLQCRRSRRYLSGGVAEGPRASATTSGCGQHSVEGEHGERQGRHGSITGRRSCGRGAAVGDARRGGVGGGRARLTP
jgi:hypothetical protein